MTNDELKKLLEKLEDDTRKIDIKIRQVKWALYKLDNCDKEIGWLNKHIKKARKNGVEETRYHVSGVGVTSECVGYKDAEILLEKMLVWRKEYQDKVDGFNEEMTSENKVT